MVPSRQPASLQDRTHTGPARPPAAPSRAPLAPEIADLVQLQRTAGNRAVVRLLGGLAPGQPPAPANGQRLARIQAKLSVGPADDPYEREADQMADRVLRQVAAAPPTPPQLIEDQPLARRQAVATLEMEPEDEEPLAETTGEGPAPATATGSPPPEEDLGLMRLQRVPARAALDGGFDVSGDFESALQAGRGGGAPLPAATRAQLEPHFAADFSAVRVHADAEAARLSRAVSAQAFTHGADIYMGAGKYNPGSSAGQHLLAHELTHVVQQGGAALQRQPGAFELQRAFEPVTTSADSHLRPGNAGNVNFGAFLGRQIPAGEEVVADLTQTVTQRRRVLSNVTWARAVDVRADAWDPALDPTRGGYLRFTKAVPRNAVETVDVNMPARVAVRAERHFHENVGQYLDIEESLDRPGHRLISLRNEYRALNPANMPLVLNDRERMQTGRTDAIRARVDRLVRDVALARHIPVALLATPENVEKLLKPLRAGTLRREELALWLQWSGAVYTRIQEGVEQLCDALTYWTGWLGQGDPAGVALNEVQLLGSDLHERGVGAVRVRFTKPANAHPLFPGTAVTAVIKPDDRSAERSLLGSQAGSLANQLNQRYAVAAGDANLLPTIRMETHAAHGAFIEFVQGTKADDLGGHEAVSQSLIEAVSLAMITGLGDLHGENILWRDGKPYLIDADNVLLHRLYTPPEDEEMRRRTVAQSGFTKYNETSRDMALGLHTNPEDSHSLIMQEMLADARPLVALVRGALQNRRGRIVPLRTNRWASWLNTYPRLPEGTAADDRTVETKWGMAALGAYRLPDPALGAGLNLDYGPGLVGETGEAAPRHYPAVTAKAQIKHDFDRGQIPFYNYDFTSGHVLHNNQDVWHGRTLDDVMNALLARFPVPAPVVV